MTRRRAYNPGQLTAEELKASFVVRQDELTELLSALRAQKPGQPCQHMLLVGARGMGKTTLGLRFLEAVKEDPELAATWQPVPFHEESYDIAALGDFWLAALRHLTRATGEQHWEQHADTLIRDEPDHGRREAYALASLLDFCQTTGRRAILFVENLDLIFHQIGDEREIHALRGVLIEHPELLVLGSANASFDAIRSHGAPFYEFFRLVTLDGLAQDGCLELFQAVCERDGHGERARRLSAERGRMEVVRRLTGGNPRLLTLAAQMLAESPLGSAFEDLEALVDEQTPYFKSLIEALPVQARKVFHHLAGAWTPMLAREIAEGVDLSPSHVSAQLRQLTERRYVRELRLPNEKRKRYEVVDRFYNIYYLLRFNRPGRARLARLVAFLHDLFGETAARGLYQVSLQSLRARRLPDEELANWLQVLSKRVVDDPGFDNRLGWLKDALGLGLERLGANAPLLDDLDQALGPTSGFVYVARGLDLCREGRLDEAEATLRRGAAHLPTPDLHWGQLALALVLCLREQPGQAMALIKMVSPERSADDDRVRLLILSVLPLAVLKSLPSGDASLVPDAVERIRTLARIDDNPNVRKHCCFALRALGDALQGAAQHTPAVEAWSLASELALPDDPPGVRLQAALALRARGERLAEVGRSGDAIASFRQAVSFVQMSDNAASRLVAVEALVLESSGHTELDETSKATDTLLRAVTFIRGDDTADLRELGGRLAAYAGWVRLWESTKGELSLGEISTCADLASEWDPAGSAGDYLRTGICARVADWSGALVSLQQALERGGEPLPGLADTLIQIAAAGYVVQIRDLMSDTRLVDELEPLWHAIRLELGEQIEPLPLEVMGAVTEIRSRLSERG